MSEDIKRRLAELVAEEKAVVEETAREVGIVDETAARELLPLIRDKHFFRLEHIKMRRRIERLKVNLVQEWEEIHGEAVTRSAQQGCTQFVESDETVLWLMAHQRHLRRHAEHASASFAVLRERVLEPVSLHTRQARFVAILADAPNTPPGDNDYPYPDDPDGSRNARMRSLLLDRRTADGRRLSSYMKMLQTPFAEISGPDIVQFLGQHTDRILDEYGIVDPHQNARVLVSRVFFAQLHFKCFAHICTAEMAQRDRQFCENAQRTSKLPTSHFRLHSSLLKGSGPAYFSAAVDCLRDTQFSASPLDALLSIAEMVQRICRETSLDVPLHTDSLSVASSVSSSHPTMNLAQFHHSEMGSSSLSLPHSDSPVASVVSAPPLESQLNADDLMSIIVYVVTMAQVPQMMSILSYIDTFTERSFLLGSLGYCLSSVEGAAMYVCSLADEPVQNNSPLQIPRSPQIRRK